MRSVLINSLIFNRKVVREICEKFEIKGFDLEVLAIVDSISNSDKKNHCTMLALRAMFPQSYYSHTYLRVDYLLEKGYLNNLPGFKRKFRLVLSGSGDYVLREYSRLIHRAIREREGKQAKRLKYSFFKEDI